MVTCWHVDMLTCWHVDMVTSWHDDKLTCWQEFRMTWFWAPKFEITTYLLTHSLTRVKSRDASASKKQPAEQLNGYTSSAYMKDPNPTSVCRHDVISMWTCNLPPDRHPDKDTTQYPNTLPAEASADSDYLNLSRYLAKSNEHLKEWNFEEKKRRRRRQKLKSCPR